ncbi:hypothetical protein FFLO_06689 [Filobasidium floriforme]|uniref:Uncharacterized protein n=1 Tax=Filobasidium floriforme TaxID=5210 RepID=A0A8K0JGC4_9TREE|nr:hypothetical protein FFLO_06689 [Filobasidium floriforme]
MLFLPLIVVSFPTRANRPFVRLFVASHADLSSSSRMSGLDQRDCLVRTGPSRHPLVYVEFTTISWTTPVRTVLISAVLKPSTQIESTWRSFYPSFAMDGHEVYVSRSIRSFPARSGVETELEPRYRTILGQASARVEPTGDRIVGETRGGSSQLNIPLATIETIPATWSPSGSQRPNSVLRYWSSRNQHMEKFGRAGESTDLRSSFRIRSGMHLSAPILRLNMATLQQDHGNRRGTGRQHPPSDSASRIASTFVESTGTFFDTSARAFEGPRDVDAIFILI